MQRAFALLETISVWIARSALIAKTTAIAKGADASMWISLEMGSEVV